jgi:hypothetical protein
MPSQDCYFFMNMEEPEEERKMHAFCVSCIKKRQHESALFWQGSLRGYGKYKIICKDCNLTIHEVEE